MWFCKVNGIISGAPVAMARPRVTKFGTYTAPKSKAYMDSVIKELHDKDQKLEGPIRLVVIFVHPRPKRITCVERTPKTTKPDIDNLVKMVMDIFSKANVWCDDNQVTEIHAMDYYANAYEQPHTMYQVYTAL